MGCSRPGELLTKHLQHDGARRAGLGPGEVYWANFPDKLAQMTSPGSGLALSAPSLRSCFGKWLWGTEIMEHARLENMQLVRQGRVRSVDEARFMSNGVTFRTKYLQEPNTDLRCIRD